MQKTIRKMPAHKNIALVAHDNHKPELLRWVTENKEKLQGHFLYATRTTSTCSVKRQAWLLKV